MLASALLQIADCLHERFGLDALWLFGSEARGTATSESDLDVAALFRRRPLRAELLEARLDLADLLARDVDLVDLDNASPILVMQVLSNGRLLVENDPVHRRRLVEAAPGRYEDLKIVRREAARSLLERVPGGRS